MTDKKRRQLLSAAIKRLKMTKEGYSPEGGHWRAAMTLLEDLDNDLKPDVADVPDLGPLVRGGLSLLKMSPTHQTSGLPLYPAVDTAWTTGTTIIAPEAGEVTRHSGNENGGYSVYVTGKSGLKYFFVHLFPDRRAPLGQIKKGDRVGVVGSPSRFPAQRVAHVHAGVNVEALWGEGKQLLYGKTGKGPDYTTGSPSIGEQLERNT